jgi:hypothetical protein
MKLVDYPMDCCGIVEASGINLGEDRRETDPAKREAAWDRVFDRITEHQKNHRRNCAMITLSDNQPEARAAAEARGWISVFEFFNPNSYNKVRIYTKVLWPSRKEYGERETSGEYRTPPRPAWLYAQAPVEVDPNAL